MLEPSKKDRLARVFERIDNTACVAIFFAASMPAIVVMLLIAFPLLPLIAVWVAWIAATDGWSRRAELIAHEHEDEGHVEPPHGATPHYA